MENTEPLASEVTTNANRDLPQKGKKIIVKTPDEMEIMSQESTESKMEVLSQESRESKMEFSSQGSDTSKMDYTNLSEDNTPEVMMANADSSTPDAVSKNAETDKGKCSVSSTMKRKASKTKIANSMQQFRERESVLTFREEALTIREKAVLVRELAASKRESAVNDRKADILRLMGKKNKTFKGVACVFTLE